jgi:hypothetical protein
MVISSPIFDSSCVNQSSPPFSRYNAVVKSVNVAACTCSLVFEDGDLWDAVPMAQVRDPVEAAGGSGEKKVLRGTPSAAEEEAVLGAMERVRLRHAVQLDAGRL